MVFYELLLRGVVRHLVADDVTNAGS
jgi:hypothetical protein